MNIAKRIFRIKSLLNVDISLKLINKQNIASFSYLNSNKFSFLEHSKFLRFSSDQKRNYMDLTSVLKIFEEKVPSNLAESWDNTGLLIEPSKENNISTIFFTNDLTEVVLKEALSVKSNLIISYHPPIFAPMKSLKMSNWKDRIVIKCIENSIAVYSPHTNCDAVQNGVNDWLINCFDLSDCHPILPSYEPAPKYSHILEASVPADKDVSELIKSVPGTELCHISADSESQTFRVKVNKASLNSVVQSLVGTTDVPSMSVTPLNALPIPGCGMGRIGKLSEPLPLGECIKLVKSYLKLERIRFTRGIAHTLESPISTVAVCAGSGSGVLKGACADLYVTGEMSHHELLDVSQRNVSVLLCEHSNSERGYLTHLADSLAPRLLPGGVKLIVSSTDKDPVTIV